MSKNSQEINYTSLVEQDIKKMQDDNFSFKDDGIHLKDNLSHLSCKLEKTDGQGTINKIYNTIINFSDGLIHLKENNKITDKETLDTFMETFLLLKESKKLDELQKQELDKKFMSAISKPQNFIIDIKPTKGKFSQPIEQTHQDSWCIIC